MHFRKMKRTYLFIAAAVSTFAMSCNSASDQKHEQNKQEVPADKEIKLEDVNDQIKTDQERADSIKKALGIE